EPDAAREALGEIGPDVALRLGELDALDGAAGVGVAEVAEELGPLRLDEKRGVRAGEADEVADVGAARDEERLLEQRTQPVDAGHRRLSARNSSASRYPSGPLPTTRVAAISVSTECRRHSSRSSMFDRCTSTTGASISSSASRIA